MFEARERLLLDAMLGKLATYLRMCGYDAAYALDRDAEADDAALALAVSEDRLLLTRDEHLANRAPESVLLRERDVTDQLRELAAAGLDLELPAEPTRCGVCNGPVERVESSARTPEYAPDAGDERVWRCADCGQHFWKGSHWDAVAATLDGL
ncbi:Mut7-C RNAse domain-containing protein [Haloarcula salina]|uniref:Mut7-C RNAse domain-containing protein n=1 Tax=Haloarcula salina TaxID=1429914 RepID=UPI003C6F4F74